MAVPRVTVSSPRTVATRWPKRAVTQEIDDETGVGDAFMRSLIRSQLRLGLSVIVVLATLVVGLPIMFTVAPGLTTAEVLGIPIPWLLLGFAVYPLLVALGWFYVRQAERNERDFSDLVDRR